MPVHSIDSEKRLNDVKSRRRDEFQRRIDAGDPPSLHEVLELGPGEEFREKTKFLTAQGNEKSKMVYFFQGIPVYDCHIVAEKNPSTGEYVSMMNNFWSGIADELPSGDLISAEDALCVACHSEGDSREDIISEEPPELQINVDKHTHKARKLYRVSYFTDGESGPKRPVYLVDATTKEVFDHWDQICLQPSFN